MTVLAKTLYADFLENPQAYRASERYWEQLTAAVADSLGQAGQWRQWIPRTYADGKTPIDTPGNPIWDGRSDQLDRAYRIIQHPPHGDDVRFYAWVTEYEEEYTDLPRAELVLSLVLSDEAARQAETLLRKWMTPETTADQMEAFIAEHVPSK